MDTQTASNLSIHKAAEQGDLARVKQLIETGTASADEVDSTSSEWAVLHYAAKGGHKEIIEFLLSQGATLDIKNLSNGTPLDIAIASKHADITQLLLEEGADPNNIYAGTSCLHTAAAKGCTTIITQLLKYGALPEYLAGETVLHSAELHRQPRSILALYPHANSTVRDTFDFTPIERLIRKIAQSNSAESPELIQCLYAFLCAGEVINEEVILQAVTPDWFPSVPPAQFPEVMEIIKNAISFKEEIENRLGYLGSDVVTHILLQSPREREALLNGKDALEELGYRHLSGIRNFLFTSKKERKDFLWNQRLFKHPTLRKATQSEDASILDLPPELLQMCLENLLSPDCYLDDIKRSIEQREVSTYTSPRPS